MSSSKVLIFNIVFSLFNICWSTPVTTIDVKLVEEPVPGFEGHFSFGDLFEVRDYQLNPEKVYQHKSVRIVDSNLRVLPSNFGDVFPNVQFLRITAQLRDVRNTDFEKLTKLEHLFMPHNRLSDLPSRAFATLTSLTTLSLKYNVLKNLPSDVFAGLESLEILDLSENHLVSMTPEMLSPLVSLKSLNLNSNAVVVFADNLFEHNPNLTDISMTENEFGNLPDNIFSSLKNLKSLDLSYNQMEKFVAPSVELLLCADNRLTEFQSKGPISSLHLNNNKLESVPSIDYSETAFLDLSDNNLTDLTALKNAVNLKQLKLNNNKQKLPSSDSLLVIKDLVNLESLELSNMKLTEEDVYQEGLFTGLKYLQRLDLSDNQFNVIRLSAFNLNSLQEVRVGHEYCSN